MRVIFPWRLVGFAGICLASAGQAQEWQFRQYDEPEFITDTRMSDVSLDRQEHVWIATWGAGVFEISETTQTQFDARDGLPSDWTYRVVVDDHNTTWVASPDGISEIKNQVVAGVYTQENFDRLPANEIWTLSVLRDGSIAGGVGNGYIFRFDPTDLRGTWKFIATPEDLGEVGVHDIWESEDGIIWAAAERGGLWRLEGEHWIKVESPGFDLARVDGVYEDTQHRIYAWGFTKWCVYESGVWAPLPEASARILTVRQSPDGRIFVGTEKGLFEFETTKGWMLVEMGRPVGLPYVREFIFDPRGMIWLACYEGVVQGVRPIWSDFTQSTAGAQLLSTSVASHPNYAPYAFDAEGNLTQFLDNRWKVLAPFKGVEPIHLVRSKVSPALLYALTPSALLVINLDSLQQEKSYPIPPTYEASELFEMPDGTLYLVALTGIYLLREGNWMLLPEERPDLQGGRYTGIARAPDNSLYLCTEVDAWHWKDGNYENLNKQFPELIDKHFLDVLVTRSGEVWLSTSGEGIYLLRQGRLLHLTREDGLPSNRVAKVYEASDGTIWVCSRRRGISAFKDARWIRYKNQHGLPNSNAEYFFEWPQGVVWFTTNGSGIFRFVRSFEPPSTSILSAPEEIPYRRTGMVWFSGRDAWNRTSQEDMVYSWRLVPARGPKNDAGWTSFSSQTVAELPLKPPGSYYFQARTADMDRNIDPTPASIQITVNPPLWLTPAFLVPTCILGLIALSALAAWFRVLQKEKRAKHALELSAASLENAQRVAHLGSWEWDVDAGTLKWSAEVYRIFAMDPETGPPSSADFMQAVHPEDREIVDAHFERAVSCHIAPSFDHRIVRPGGEIRHVHEQGELVLDERGRVIRVFGTLADITDRKLNEQERDRLIEDLKKALADVRTLSGLVPICANCKNIRDDQGYWQQIECYIRDRSYAEFSHSICPDCAEVLYGDRTIGDHR